LNERDKLTRSVNWIHERIDTLPNIGMILGSGLSESLNFLQEVTELNWRDIPGFPQPTVKGHSGKLLIGEIYGEPVLVQQGRIHWYEGQDWENVLFPVRVQTLLGVEKLIITNAAGGINRNLLPGDLVLITDHINFCGDNPLRGPNDERFGLRFPDLTNAYSKDLGARAEAAATKLDMNLKSGVYVMTTGPSYETPAEIRALRALGADLVGMSTVPEVIAARHANVEVLAISCVTNKAAGMQDQLTHEEVIQVTTNTNDKLGRLIQEIVNLFDN